MSRERLINWLLAAFLFALPWQTRWIFAQATISGEPFSLGAMSLYATQVLLIVTFVVWLSGRPKIQDRAKLVRAYGAFMFVALLSVLFAVNRDLAWTQLMHVALAGVLCLLVTDKNTDTKLMAQAFAAGLVVPVVLGAVQLFGGHSGASTWLGLAARDAQALGDAVVVIGGDRFLRAYGSLPHPNIFGGFLAVGMLCGVYVWQRATTHLEKALVFTTMFFCAVGLATTFSRSAWLGFLVGLGAATFIAFAHGKGQRSVRRHIVAVCLVLVVVCAMGLASGRFNVSQQIESASMTERIEQYQDFPSVLVGSGWLFGTGLRNYEITLSDVDPGRAWWQYQPIHNVPLLVIGEIGVAGFLLLVVFIARIAIIHFRTLPRADALIGFSLGTVLFAATIFDHYVWSTWAGLALSAFVLALIYRFSQDYEAKYLG